MGGEVFHTAENDTAVGVRLRLLGGFRAEHSILVPDAAWQQRRSAKALVKLLATYPGHSLHREQILDLLWPEVEFASAVNSFGKALHVARRALEPEIASRGTSSYLRLADDILSLVTQDVWVDADHFQAAGEDALHRGDVDLLKTALASYTGDLLPEDTYESWTIARRSALADLHLRLGLALAEAYVSSGRRDMAIEQLVHALQLDPAREDVHCRLIRLYAQSGQRLLALRQYQLCCEALDRELDARPEAATVALYEDIREGRLGESNTGGVVTERAKMGHSLPDVVKHLVKTSLVGRDATLHLLLSDLKSAASGYGGTVMVSGEVGVGKSRLAAEVARVAGLRGALVLWGTNFEQDRPLPYSPYVTALESHMATLSAMELQSLAIRYPALVSLIPSLTVDPDSAAPSVSQHVDQDQFFTAIVRLLTELCGDAMMVLVLDNLHTASRESIHLLHHLAQLTGQRRWLILATYREEELVPGGELPHMIAVGTRQRLCSQVNLPRLSRHHSDKLVHALIQTGTPSPALLEHIYSLSLGNPLYLSELVGAMQGRGELTLLHGFLHLAPTTSTRVPRQVERLVYEQVERLGARAQRALSLLAVANADLSFDELLLAMQETEEGEMSEAALLDLLDAGLASRILEEHEDAYGFSHPLFQAALCGRLSRSRSIQLHGALAHAIEACRPKEAEVLAHHHAAHNDHERAIIYLQETVSQAQQSGLRQMEENSLWSLLEQLHLLGRREDAQTVRQKLTTLLQDSAIYGVLPKSGEQQEHFDEAEHAIA
jgi:DNA-binding SARP family transcriptional activator